MTTIAYRDGVMAADSRAMVSGWKQPFSANKIRRLDDGSIIGVCGDLAYTEAAFRALNSSEMLELPEKTSVIRLLGNSTIRVYELKGHFDMTVEYGAWGSGSPAAWGALAMGADARRAVEIAAQFDDSTGGNIVTMSIGAKD